MLERPLLCQVAHRATKLCRQLLSFVDNAANGDAFVSHLFVYVSVRLSARPLYGLQKRVRGRFWPFWSQIGYGVCSLVLNRACFFFQRNYCFSL